ncbi:urease accessory protein UreF [Helicobacter cappadocius]|uniref:Urease accessory protein UreF n=1 Tax=Helicobacter cappadocius TaxID=3063998 RepID=A0AA90SSJ3_9HELI|nr:MULTISPECIES: urease accessory protein UreF [unclassified Helicobacter]MDO7252910.1 urease accessory protein UreF [Helicobacter sp. faydin-H75]MDP2538954.1 urease accessory protein UreF [Helicobacter sp. faydin-H76]
MILNKDFLLLQINDALFPIGSYTHSFGLESYIQMGKVKDSSSALEYIQSNLHTAFLYNELLAIKLIYKYAIEENLQKILEIEELVCISSSPMELRFANQKLGARFLKTIKIMELSAKDFFQVYLQSTKTPTHSSAYAVFCACMGLELSVSIRHYLYAQCSNTVTNCVKTIPLSQNDGQKILLRLHNTFEKVLQELEKLEETHLCSSSIHNDIKAMQHETLYSRLYMS